MSSGPNVYYNILLYTPFVVSPMDYSAVSTLLTFASCGTRQCASITIINDVVAESAESFFVNLQRTPGLDHRITLNPDVGQITII